jgi:hypothetical protein
MNIANIGHAFKGKDRKANEAPGIDPADPLIQHASREVCTYVCDVMYRMGIRSYDPELAQMIAAQMLGDLQSSARWSAYLENTAPKMSQEMLGLLNISDTES